MKRTIALALFAVFTATLFMGATAPDKNQIERTWWNQEKTSKIQIYLAKDGNYYGKIVHLNEPNDEKTGKPKLDKENPDETKRSAPVMGMLVLKGFKVNPEDKNQYIDGRIYDPENGKTYCGKITFKGKSLDLRGFLCSASFLGRTAVWTLAE